MGMRWGRGDGMGRNAGWEKEGMDSGLTTFDFSATGA